MQTLPQIYPDVSDLLANAPNDLVPVLLRIAQADLQKGMVHVLSVNNAATQANDLRPPPAYVRNKDVQLLLGEVWAIIESERLVIPAPDINGQHGFKVFTRRGLESLRLTTHKRCGQSRNFRNLWCTRLRRWRACASARRPPK
jgi:hypothetical protein